MYFKGNYYPFCNRGFTREFATLACRALGFWYGGFVLPSKGINFLETIEVGNCPSVENGVWDYQRNYLEECINSTFSLSTNECDAVQVTCLLPCKYRIIYPGFVSNKVDYVILFFFAYQSAFRIRAHIRTMKFSLNLTQMKTDRTGSDYSTDTQIGLEYHLTIPMRHAIDITHQRCRCHVHVPSHETNYKTSHSQLLCARTA